MPKQTFKIEGFHGGLNSNSDPRDIRDNESPSLKDVAIDSVGKIKTLGSVDNGNVLHSGTAQAGASTTITLASGASSDDDRFNNYSIILTGGTGSGQLNIITDYVGSSKVATVSSWSTNPDNTTTYEIIGDANAIAILQNRGLFVMSSDRQLDAGSGNETLIFCFDSGSNTIDIKDSEGWDTAVINMGGAAVPIYYAADGVVRVSDSTLTQTPQWFGYIADERFNGLASDSGSIAWTNVSQSLTAPTVGKCLMSTPAVGTDTNGVNSSSSEYIGNAADASETQGDVLDAAAVNLRVGIQYSNLLPNTDSDISEDSDTTDTDDTTDLKPFIGNNNLKLVTNGTDDKSLVSDDSIEYTIDDTQSFVIAFYITSHGSEYDYTDYVRVQCGSSTTGGYAWTITKADIKADCWNVLVCSKDTHDSAGTNIVDWGGTFTAWSIVLRQNSTASSPSPDWYISGPVIAPSATLDGFQPGNYSFHYTWLYDDENKQESLPFKFSDVDNDDNTKDVNQIVIHKNPCLFNFDAYICPWSMSTAAATDASEHQIDDTSHGLIVGDIVRFNGLSNTGGIDNNTDYYVSSQSLVANSFRVSTSLANAIAGTSVDFSGSDDGSITYIYYKINKRISGSRLYYKVEENDNYFLIGELDFVNKGFKFLPEADTLSFTMANTADATYPILSKTALIKGISPETANTIDTFKTINGFSTEVKSLDAKYKTAVVHGRRVYIGNIKRPDDKTYPDRIVKSQVNRFDTFPEGMGSVDVVIRDGESIVKLEAYADRILQFKQHSLYIINVSESVDFLEDTYRNKGCAFDYHVTRTDMGIVWFNDHGCYLYNGKTVLDLLEKQGIRLISEEDWEAFVTDGVDGSADDPDMSSAMIGYVPKKKHLIIKNENNDIYLYDFVLQAWTTGVGKITETTAMTNFALDGDQNLFYIDNTTTVRKTWQTSAQTSIGFEYITPDIDFGEPGLGKKVYKVIITYKSGATTNVQVDYDVNGGTTFPYDFANGDNFTSNELASASGWQVAELIPDNSNESNNIKSFQLRFATDGTVPSGFEINDITIVYRLKNIK